MANGIDAVDAALLPGSVSCFVLHFVSLEKRILLVSRHRMRETSSFGGCAMRMFLFVYICRAIYNVGSMFEVCVCCSKLEGFRMKIVLCNSEMYIKMALSLAFIYYI